MTPEVAAEERWDAVVIGAGPAGAAAALLLARSGARVLLVERKTFPRYKVCGGCLSARAVQLLTSLGVGQALASAGALPLERVVVHAARRTLSLPMSGGRALSRATLDSLLVQEAVQAGAHLLTGVYAEVEGVEGPNRRVALTSRSESPPPLSGPVRLRAGVVLAADGLGHPSLRRLGTFGERVSESSYLGAGSVLPAGGSWPEPHALHMVVGGQGYAGVVRVEHQGVNIAAALAPSFVSEMGGLGPAILSMLRGTGAPGVPELEGVRWQGTPLLTRRTVPLADTRLFLLGDAAGYVEPFTGEGMTWALSSAQALVPLALEGAHDWRDSLVAEWEERHRRTLSLRPLASRSVARTLRSPRLMRGALAAGAAFPGLGGAAVRWIAGSSPRPTAPMNP